MPDPAQLASAAPVTHHCFLVDAWTDELLADAPRHATQVERYACVPDLFFATATDDAAEHIAQLPGVRARRPATEAERRMVYSVDYHTSNAIAHVTTTVPNGIANATTERLREGVPRYPVLTMSVEGPEWSFDAELELPTRACYFAALNISLEPRPPLAYDPDHPVNVATRSVSSVLPVVFAAGNIHPGDTDVATSAWAQPPWVIGVGAVRGHDDHRVADYSRGGTPDGSVPGPTVVAVGTDEETGEPGTSFASPRVSTELGVLAGVLLAVRSVALGCTGAAAEGAPLVARTFVDIGIVPGIGDPHGSKVADLREPTRRIPALPLGAVDRDVVATLVASAPLADVLTRLPVPTLLRRLLIAAAIPLPDEPPWRAGAGLVTPDGVDQFLLGMNARTVLTHADVAVGEHAALDAPLLSADLVSGFAMGIRDSMLAWANGPDLFDTTAEQDKTLFVEDGKADGAP